MPLIAQICMVVVTIALAVLAVMVIRLMLQTKVLIETANRSLAELPALIETAKQTSARADDLLTAFAHITRFARAGASRFENIATRSSTLASTLLDEVEHPISELAGAIRGLRAGARFLVERWKARAGSRSHTTEGDDHDGEQGWLDDGGVPGGNGGRGRVGADLRTRVR